MAFLKACLRPALLILCAAWFSLQAYGSVWSWSGGGGANAYWNNSANWGFAGIPTNGDTLIFPASQPNLLNTNNIAGLVLNQIRFVGAGGGYDLRGNAFTVTNNIEATNTVGANTIENYITFSNVDQSVDVAVSLTLSGVLSGPVGLVKNGTGTLQLNGPLSNTYGGTTTVNSGLLQLAKSGSPAATAIPGNLVVGNGSSAATVQNILNIEITNTANVTINNAGLWDMNGYYETIGTNLTLNGNASLTNANPLFLSPNATVTANPGFLANCSIGGKLNINSNNCTFNVSGGLLIGSLLVPASVSGAATITKTGAGYLFLTASNSFTGQVNIANGTLAVGNSYALGSTNAGTTVSNTATLWIASVSVTNEPLTIASTGIGLENASGANSWVGTNITLAAATTFEVDGASLELQCPIVGSGGFTKTGTGTLTLDGSTANSYAGSTTVNGGLLQLGKPNSITAIPGPLALGTNTTVRLLNHFQINNPATPVTLADFSMLDLAGFNEWVGPTSLQGAQITSGAGTFYFSGNITVNASTNAQSLISGNAQLFSLTYTNFAITNTGHNYSPDLVISANLSSGGSTNGLIKAGAGEVSLTGNNSFAGPVTINGGDLWAQTSTALGMTNFPATVNNGGSLYLDGAGLDFGLKPLVLNGSGYSFGALTCSGSSSWEGGVTLVSDSTISPFTGSSLTFTSTISGTGGLIEQGPGTLTLAGPISNTYGGTTTVNGGTLVLNKVGGFIAVPGNLVINTNSTVRLANVLQTANSADVLVNNGGLFDFSIYFTYLNTLRGLGTVNFGNNGYIYLGLNNGSSEFDGSFIGSGFAPGFTVGKTGTGTFTLGGNSSYSAGITHVYNGTLVVNGSQPQIPVQVDVGATLSGTGTIGAISASGTIAPGNGPGILNCSNVTFNSSGNLTVELTGPNPGMGGYDQLNVTGTNTLANATLTVIPSFTTPVAIGQQFVILNNDLADAVTGTFNGLAQGATLTAGNYTFSISYVGGTGNDIVLTLTSLPAAVAGTLVTSGDGSHGIDPNGCNNLGLVITNTSGNAMTGISATLSTTTEGVLITQPYATYPNIPANGTGTNFAPFQISTLPSFVCGTPINLQLSVNSSLGAFTLNFVQATGEPAAPVRFDDNIVTNVPDVGIIESTNTVSGWAGGQISKVTVSLWLVAPVDSAMSISLISPDGTTVLLAAAVGGASSNFGSGSADASRTTFDDAAATAITSGAAPFVGTFRPQSPLAAFVGTSPNGAWRLHIQDSTVSGTPDTLRAWSLFLNGTACNTGSGICDLCTPGVTNAITLSDPVQSGRWIGNLTVASCGAPKAWAGTTGGSFHYKIFSFTNTSVANACVTVELQSPSNLLATAYLNNGFNPASITSNYLGDAGDSTHGGQTTFSCTVPASNAFEVVVTEVTANAGTQPFTLQLSGLPCPPPTLGVQTVPAGQARLYWPTWAGGYLLQATPSLAPTNWTYLTNEPIVSSLKYNVTNSTSQPTNRFYRLLKP